MRKFFTIFFLLIVAAIAILYLFSGMILDKVTRIGIGQATLSLAENNIKIVKTAFQGTFISSPNSVTCKGLTFVGATTKSSAFGMEQEFSVYADKVTLSLVNLADRTFTLKATGARALSSGYKAFATDDTNDSEDQIEDGDLSVRLQLVSFDPQEVMYQLKGLSALLGAFLQEGRTAMPVEFSGLLRFKSKNRSLSSKVMVKKEGEYYVLAADKEDIKKLSRELGIPLNDKEAALMAGNPMRIPGVMKVYSYVTDSVAKKTVENPDLPRDAYKDILWSYLITKAYGDEFSKALSDAHGEGAGTNPMREQEIANDAVGRRYARQEIDEADIAKRIMNDPAVILYPRTPVEQAPALKKEP